MQVTVVTPPAAIVTLDEARAQLRLDIGGVDDALLNRLIATATATVDGPDGWLGRTLGIQTLRLTTGSFRESITLPLPPIGSVEAVTYLPLAGGAAVAIDPSSYYLQSGRILASVPGWVAPPFAARPDALSVTYVAGYQDVPAPLRHAILMMVARLFQARGEDVPPNLVEDRAIQNLLSPFRVWG